jgi:pimeloyl-ACP methyl ester carboxylesterase
VIQVLGVLILVITLLIVFGPKPKFEAFKEYQKLPPFASLQDMEHWLGERESEVDLRPNNYARFIWADSVPQKTEWSLVYVHGWSASPEEGNPVHQEFAERYGCNLFLARLPRHGESNIDALGEITPAEMQQSVLEAVEIGNLIGDKVILMSTSTGGTLSAWAASESKEIDALISYSPNIRIADSKAGMLNGPWAAQILSAVYPDGYRSWEDEATDSVKNYWSVKYPAKALMALQELVESTMTEKTFEKITQPTFVGVYYRDEENQDDVISVAAAEEFYERLPLAENKKRYIEFPNVNNHGVAGKWFSEDLESVRKETFKFAEEVLGMQPK